MSPLELQADPGGGRSVAPPATVRAAKAGPGLGEGGKGTCQVVLVVSAHGGELPVDGGEQIQPAPSCRLGRGGRERLGYGAKGTTSPPGFEPLMKRARFRS